MRSECTANAQRLRRRETVILMSSEVVLLVYLVSVFVLLVDQLLLLSLSLVVTAATYCYSHGPNQSNFRPPSVLDSHFSYRSLLKSVKSYYQYLHFS